MPAVEECPDGDALPLAEGDPKGRPCGGVRPGTPCAEAASGVLVPRRIQWLRLTYTATPSTGPSSWSLLKRSFVLKDWSTTKSSRPSPSTSPTATRPGFAFGIDDAASAPEAHARAGTAVTPPR